MRRDPTGGIEGLWLALRSAPGQLRARSLGYRSTWGLDERVWLGRDDRGFAHATVQTWRDASFAQGYLCAEDRLVHIDLRRRLLSGRLAEVLGEELLALDAAMRALDLRSAAEQSYRALPPPTKERFDAYARGVNAWIDTGAWRRCRMYRQLDSQPRFFAGADSMLLLRGWALDSASLSGGLRTSLAANAAVSDEARAALAAVTEVLSALDEPPLGGAALEGTCVGIPPLPGHQGAIGALYAGPASFPVPLWAIRLHVVPAGPRASGARAEARRSALFAGARSRRSREAQDPARRGEAKNYAGLALAGVPGMVAGTSPWLAWCVMPEPEPPPQVHAEEWLSARKCAQWEAGAVVEGWDRLRSSEEEVPVRGLAHAPLVRRRTPRGVVLSDAHFVGSRGTDVAERAPADAALSSVSWGALQCSDEGSFCVGVMEAKSLEEATALASSWKSPRARLTLSDGRAQVSWRPGLDDGPEAVEEPTGWGALAPSGSDAGGDPLRDEVWSKLERQLAGGQRPIAAALHALGHAHVVEGGLRLLHRTGVPGPAGRPIRVEGVGSIPDTVVRTAGPEQEPTGGPLARIVLEPDVTPKLVLATGASGALHHPHSCDEGGSFRTGETPPFPRWPTTVRPRVLVPAKQDDRDY